MMSSKLWPCFYWMIGRAYLRGFTMLPHSSCSPKSMQKFSYGRMNSICFNSWNLWGLESVLTTERWLMVQYNLSDPFKGGNFHLVVTQSVDTQAIIIRLRQHLLTMAERETSESDGSHYGNSCSPINSWSDLHPQMGPNWVVTDAAADAAEKPAFSFNYFQRLHCWQQCSIVHSKLCYTL